MTSRKKEQGFNPNVVNFRLTNDMQSDFANARLSKDNNSAPKDPPIKVSPELWKEEFRREINAEKMEGLEARENFSPVTKPTKEERETFQTVGNFEMIKLLKSAGW